MNDHIVETAFEDDQAYWECSCGKSGSSSIYLVDVHSDRHIREQGGHRIDRHTG
jgi:hypothetical protein